MVEWDYPRPVHDAYNAVCNRDFLEVPQLPGIPYFCPRICKRVPAAAMAGATFFFGDDEHRCFLASALRKFTSRFDAVKTIDAR